MKATLRSYFETAGQQGRALKAVAHERWLDPSGNLDLYEVSHHAFDPSLSSDEALRYFEKIYNELKGPGWQVFRSRQSDVSYWSSQQVFETIKREFAEYSWGGSVNLSNFQQSGDFARLKSSLDKMQGIKQKKGYPHMAVSKFLHFYNPSLFPIYDQKVIWEKVFSRFEDDFQDFCKSENIPYPGAIEDDTAYFIIYYMRWASSLLAVAHENFMQVFVEWLEQRGVDLRQRQFDAATLFATAFEFTAIGAAQS
ncbi:MAG TPA: hypothetical protein VHT24_05225 [Pseudacidobacterium sp.]|jgi:hypothetical protein|nr:hypothetical protein [Pseudacidobacterium sp.]